MFPYYINQRDLYNFVKYDMKFQSQYRGINTGSRAILKVIN